ncbi:hypothetical protein [Verminephrobacter eiseniae]|uniref:hypothetical protein n=1 Tax=Verminephrobacter eiseniae TaxID=364317 RepID=UPI002238FE1C|nr:hypothetical protein [Verminephrobacter eiseniae]
MSTPTDSASMNRTPCSPANSILEGDLEIAVQQQALDKLTVAETPDGFYVIIQFKWAKNKQWYLTTRRERMKPRLFKDLIRMNRHLKEICPTQSIEILRNQQMPGQGEPLRPTKRMKNEG